MEPIAIGLDQIAQAPLLALAIAVAALTGVAKKVFGLSKENAGRYVLPLLPLVLGGVGAPLLGAPKDAGLGAAIVIGIAVGALSASIYQFVKRAIPPKD